MIVDDEPRAIRALARLLAAAPDVEIVGAADTLAEGLRAIETLRPDVAFLDVELDVGDGFELLARLSPAPRVVFVTSHADRAVDAFAVEAADYILKPVDPDRLEQALRRLRPAPRPEAAPIELATPGRTALVPPSAIAALTAEGDFTRVHLAGEPSLLILRTLSHFEERLPAPPFARLGRSTIVNLDRVRRLASRDRNLTLATLDGLVEPLPLGRAAAGRLRAALAGRAG
ncbi:LytTR family DNA-binding domain-containing protein [Albimonas sp. CAU 1670]|uniref:LytR/AlgR family response regulator transcription factor n=1 Tax=Albimonas sp. CAU 1670 TaxID=3032599 RepID=UPI0023DA0A25|nr:LytTR family DNA-binding domain-containing protein [Albimonas sp. CAU 1670]MDF2231282.1 LytTR family DNA-binding domain-containing protein [Albimonas sp. CAU 1670]